MLVAMVSDADSVHTLDMRDAKTVPINLCANVNAASQKMCLDKR